MTKPTETAIMVRLPKPLHTALRTLAYQNESSMNTLLVKLIEREVKANSAAAGKLRERVEAERAEKRAEKEAGRQS